MIPVGIFTDIIIGITYVLIVLGLYKLCLRDIRNATLRQLKYYGTKVEPLSTSELYKKNSTNYNGD